MTRNMIVALTVVGALAALARGDSMPGDYLADGQFKHAIVIRDVQGGFAGFTGRMWQIEPDGSWSTGTVFNQKIKVEHKGKLTKDQLAGLAKDFAKYDLAALKDMGKANVNPHVVTITWGKH